MAELKDLFQSADWTKEKHVPVIDAPSAVRKGEFFQVTLTVGKEIAHPNTTEHHIRWIEVFFAPDGEKFPYQVGRFEFSAHGESAQGPNTSTVFTHAQAGCWLKTEKKGTLIAAAYCNIHGLWQNSAVITIA